MDRNDVDLQLTVAKTVASLCPPSAALLTARNCTRLYSCNMLANVAVQTLTFGPTQVAYSRSGGEIHQGHTKIVHHSRQWWRHATTIATVCFHTIRNLETMHD